MIGGPVTPGAATQTHERFRRRGSASANSHHLHMRCPRKGSAPEGASPARRQARRIRVRTRHLISNRAPFSQSSRIYFPRKTGTPPSHPTHPPIICATRISDNITLIDDGANFWTEYSCVAKSISFSPQLGLVLSIANYSSRVRTPLECLSKHYALTILFCRYW